MRTRKIIKKGGGFFSRKKPIISDHEMKNIKEFDNSVTDLKGNIEFNRKQQSLNENAKKKIEDIYIYLEPEFRKEKNMILEQLSRHKAHMETELQKRVDDIKGQLSEDDVDYFSSIRSYRTRYDDLKNIDGIEFDMNLKTLNDEKVINEIKVLYIDLIDKYLTQKQTSSSRHFSFDLEKDLANRLKSVKNKINEKNLAKFFSESKSYIARHLDIEKFKGYFNEKHKSSDANDPFSEEGQERQKRRLKEMENRLAKEKRQKTSNDLPYYMSQPGDTSTDTSAQLVGDNGYSRLQHTGGRRTRRK